MRRRNINKISKFVAFIESSKACAFAVPERGASGVNQIRAKITKFAEDTYL